MDYFIRHLKTNSKLVLVSNKLFGLGASMFRIIAKHSGFHIDLRANRIDVNCVSYGRLVEFLISTQSIFGDPLKREIADNIKNLIINRTYRGTRHKHAYPSRGQRTRTNAKTKKRLFVFYANLYSGKAKPNPNNTKNIK